MQKFFGFIAMIFFLLCNLPSGSIASQKAVTETETNLYASPDRDSPVLESLDQGKSVDASNVPTSGFYRVRTQDKKIGWIKEGDLRLGSKKKATQETRSVSGKKLGFRALGGYNMFNSASAVPGLDKLGPGLSVGGELFYQFRPNLSFVVRAERVWRSVSLKGSSTGNLYIVNASSWPVAAGLDWTVMQSPSFKVSIAGLGGMAFQSGLSASAPGGVSATYTGSALTALGKGTVTWLASNHFGIFLEGGYRYLKTSTLTTTGTDDASLILAPTFNVDFSGPFVGGGLQIVF